MKKIQTSHAVLALSGYLNSTCDTTPLQQYKNIKWAFKVLQKAPFSFSNVSTIYLSELDLTIDMMNTSVKKLIKILSKSKYTYYKITMKNGSYIDISYGSTRTQGSNVIPENVIDLLHLFTQD